MNDPLDTYHQKYVMIGELKVTMQAYIILILGVIISASILFGSIYMVLQRNFRFATMLLFASLLNFAMFLYGAYLVNCLIVGKCTLLSWVLVILYVFYVIMSLFTYIGLMIMLGSKQVVRR